MSPGVDPLPAEGKLLAGRTIVITRAEDKGEALANALQNRGARVISVPTIRFVLPDDPAPLREAITGRSRFRWLLFTSSTAVRFFLEEARACGVPDGDWARFRFGVVGPTTATQLASAGIRTERIAVGGTAADLGEALVGARAIEPLGAADRCLLAQTDIGRTDVQDRLRRAGVPVETVVAYRTVAEPPERARAFMEAIEAGEPIDAIAFASPSAFENFLAMTAPAGEAAIRGRPIALASIGPTTTQAIRARGLEVAVEASPHTADGLRLALVWMLGGEENEREEGRKAE